MVFSIRRQTPRPPPLMVIISRHFLPHFCLLQLNPTYIKRILHLVSVKNIIHFHFDYLNPSLWAGIRKHGIILLLFVGPLQKVHITPVLRTQNPRDLGTVRSEFIKCQSNCCGASVTPTIIHIGCIPDICQFWNTTTLSRPVQSTRKRV